MKNKILLFAVMAVMVLGCLCACGSSGNGADTSDADITSSWKLVEMTVSGKTERYDNFPDIGGRAPKFSCTDGKNFTFTLNGKSHTGTLTESDGVYTLNLSDSKAKMEAVISGNKLTLSLADGAGIIVFETN